MNESMWAGDEIWKNSTCIAMPTAKYLLFVFGRDAGHINKCQLLAGHQLRMQSQSRVETRSKLSANTKIREGKPVGNGRNSVENSQNKAPAD